MDLTDFMLIAGVALIAGTLGQTTSGYSKGGWIVQFGMAFFGAFIGVWLAREYNLAAILTLTVSGRNFPVLYAVIGAALGVGVASFFTRTRW